MILLQLSCLTFCKTFTTIQISGKNSDKFVNIRFCLLSFGNKHIDIGSFSLIHGQVNWKKFNTCPEQQMDNSDNSYN